MKLQLEIKGQYEKVHIVKLQYQRLYLSFKPYKQESLTKLDLTHWESAID